MTRRKGWPHVLPKQKLNQYPLGRHIFETKVRVWPLKPYLRGLVTQLLVIQYVSGTISKETSPHLGGRCRTLPSLGIAGTCPHTDWTRPQHAVKHSLQTVGGNKRNAARRYRDAAKHCRLSVGVRAQLLQWWIHSKFTAHCVSFTAPPWPNPARRAAVTGGSCEG